MMDREQAINEFIEKLHKSWDMEILNSNLDEIIIDTYEIIGCAIHKAKFCGLTSKELYNIAEIEKQKYILQSKLVGDE